MKYNWNLCWRHYNLQHVLHVDFIVTTYLLTYFLTYLLTNLLNSRLHLSHGYYSSVTYGDDS